MAVAGHDRDGEAVRRDRTGERTSPAAGRAHDPTVLERDIDPAMLTRRVRVAADRELAQNRAVRGPCPGQRVGRSDERPATTPSTASSRAVAFRANMIRGVAPRGRDGHQVDEVVTERSGRACSWGPGEPGDDVDRLPPGDARRDELADGGQRIVHRDRIPSRRPSRTEHDRDLAPRRLHELCRQLVERPTHDLFESLRQLPADGGRPLGHLRGERSQRRRQPTRRLESDDGSGPARELARERGQLARPARKVAHELVAVADETAHDQCGLDSRGPGKDGDGHPAPAAARDEPRAGIVDSGKAGVGDERDPLAPPEPLEQLTRARQPRCAGDSSARRASIPWRSRRMRVRRVSSQRTTSASRSSSRTLNVTSSRLPIGVAQTASGIRATKLRPAPRRRRGRHPRARRLRRARQATTRRSRSAGERASRRARSSAGAEQ